MKHTIKLLTMAFTLAAILTLTGCPGPVTPDGPCTHENKKTVIETAATCTETGLEKIICADCGELIEENNIEALGHDFGKWDVTEPIHSVTECKDGKKVHTCSRCNEKEEEVIPVEHDFELTEHIIATCTKREKLVDVCKVCKTKITNEKPALGHSYGNWTVTKEANCTEKGSKKHTCTRCGEEETVEIDALGHSYGNWTVTKESTCTTDGTKKRVCSRCGHEEIETIPAHHTFIAGGCECGTYEYSGTQTRLYVYTFTEDKELNDLDILYYSFEETDKTINLNDLLHLKPEYKDYTVAYCETVFIRPDIMKDNLKYNSRYEPWEHKLCEISPIGIIIEPQTN